MENAPPMIQPIGVYKCPVCNGTGKLGFTDEMEVTIREIAKRMSSNMD